MVNGIDAALNGLNQATQRANQASSNIANATTPNIGENISLPEEAVNLITAEIAFKANAATLRVNQELSEELLRIFDEEV